MLAPPRGLTVLRVSCNDDRAQPARYRTGAFAELTVSQPAVRRLACAVPRFVRPHGRCRDLATRVDLGTRRGVRGRQQIRRSPDRVSHHLRQAGLCDRFDRLPTLLRGRALPKSSHRPVHRWRRRRHRRRAASGAMAWAPTRLHLRHRHRAHRDRGRVAAIAATGVGIGSTAPEESVRSWVSISGGVADTKEVDRSDAPGCLISGTADTFAPYQRSLDTAAAMRAAGVPVVLGTLEGAGHVPVVDDDKPLRPIPSTSWYDELDPPGRPGRPRPDSRRLAAVLPGVTLPPFQVVLDEHRPWECIDIRRLRRHPRTPTTASKRRCAALRYPTLKHGENLGDGSTPSLI